VDGNVFFLVSGDDVVVGFPVHAPGGVSEFSGEFAGFVNSDEPSQGGFEDGIVRKLWEERVAGETETQFAIHFDKGLAGSAWILLIPVAALIVHVAGLRLGLVTGANYFAFFDMCGVGEVDEEIDGLAFVVLEEEALGDRVVAVVLFDDCDRRAEGAKDNGVRFELGCDVGVGDLAEFVFGFEVDGLSDDAKALIVDGNGSLGVACFAGGNFSCATGEGESGAEDGYKTEEEVFHGNPLSRKEAGIQHYRRRSGGTGSGILFSLARILFE